MPWGVLTLRKRTREQGSRIRVLNLLSYSRGGTREDCLSGRSMVVDCGVDSKTDVLWIATRNDGVFKVVPEK